MLCYNSCREVGVKPLFLPLWGFRIEEVTGERPVEEYAASVGGPPSARPPIPPIPRKDSYLEPLEDQEQLEGQEDGQRARQALQVRDRRQPRSGHDTGP
jgi:hypothetical protein